jgi:F-type H+/Na+-transporting ATPase subunit alpha
VSRVGGSAQVKGMKKVAGTMRIDLAQYRELEAFAQFGSELDKASQAQLDRGARTVEILKQPQFAPVPVEEQIVTIWAVTNGKLDHIPVADVRRYEIELRDFIASRHPDLTAGLKADGLLTDERVATLESAVDEFNQTFRPSRTEEAEEHVTLEALDTLADEGGPGGATRAEGDADYDQAQKRVVEGPGPIT